VPRPTASRWPHGFETPGPDPKSNCRHPNNVVRRRFLELFSEFSQVSGRESPVDPPTSSVWGRTFDRNEHNRFVSRQSPVPQSPDFAI
jgi:hypothetical protein